MFYNKADSTNIVKEGNKNLDLEKLTFSCKLRKKDKKKAKKTALVWDEPIKEVESLDFKDPPRIGNSELNANYRVAGGVTGVTIGIDYLMRPRQQLGTWARR